MNVVALPLNLVFFSKWSDFFLVQLDELDELDRIELDRIAFA